MIFTLELNFRNCPACRKKAVFRMDQCDQCHTPFSPESNQMIMQVKQETRQRMQRIWDGGETDPQQIHYSKFYLYSPDAGYHRIIGIPLYTLEEILVVENLMCGAPACDDPWYIPISFWLASFRYGDQDQEGSMHLLSWQLLLWDEDRQIYLVGPDEGPRTVQYSRWE